MAAVSHLPETLDSAQSVGANAQSQKIADAIRILLSALSLPDQERVLSEIANTIRPIAAPRAGGVLGAVVRLLPRSSEWTVEQVKHQVAAEGVSATSKEIYNAIGYLTRKGHIRRVGYGRYLCEGMELVTSDDLGGEPARYEGD
jgi:hypothetical protein